MGKSCGNAALLVFVANLLDIDISASAVSASASASSVASSWSAPAYRSSKSLRRRASFSSSTACFVNIESSTAAKSPPKGNSHHRRNESSRDRTCRVGRVGLMRRVGHVGRAGRAANGNVRDGSQFQAVAPRFYVSSSEGVDSSFNGLGIGGLDSVDSVDSVENASSRVRSTNGDESSSSVGSNEDVLIYPDGMHANGEFSLLKPYLEFNELDIQELFSKRNKPTSTAHSSNYGGDNVFTQSTNVNSNVQGLSQLYEDLDEVEIAHFHPDGSNSPFFFADHTPTSISSSKSTMESLAVEMEPTPSTPALAPTPLPPWLTLNQSRFAPIKLRKLQRDLSPHLSPREVETVTSAIHDASKGDFKKVAGASDFCSILVNSLEMVDVAALCASAFHYCSLVMVRERMAEGRRDCGLGGFGGFGGLGGAFGTHHGQIHSADDAECSIEDHDQNQMGHSERACLQSAGSDAKYLCALAGSGIENYGSHAVKIALDAARLKSMETLAEEVIIGGGRRNLDSTDARNLRSLLLSVNDSGDWRALAIRSAACLYRLLGLEAHRSLLSTAGNSRRRNVRCPSPEESRASQEALHIYGPLAARLGMFRLKTELEDAAFRTLYPRSHASVSALCGGENTNSVGEGMKSVLSDITHRMKRLVQEDTHFMEHIENVSIAARVKEPYSVWKKMLKMSKKRREDRAEGKEGKTGKTLRETSILDIPDAVALRVVFTARKLTPDEPDHITRHRERELCYHVLELCKATWPTPPTTIKDYVSHPKENGYQSLHYSSRQRWRGSDWPFEVQIRSSEMHRVAEYGVAAHWSYKRNDIDGEETPSSSSSHHRTKRRRLDKSSESYLKSVDEWHSKHPKHPSSTGSSSSTYYDPFASSNRDLPEESIQPFSHYLEDEIRRVRKRERDERLAPYLEALSGAQNDMTRENVFVFVSVPSSLAGVATFSPFPRTFSSASPPTEGTVLSLPRGSRVLDAIRVAEKWSSNLGSTSNLNLMSSGSFVALRNGLRTSSMATEQLSNGDVVSILPSSELVSSKGKEGREGRSLWQ